jgi:hypothetical protein
MIIGPALAAVAMMLSPDAGPPLSGLLFKARVAHALFITSYLLVFSLCIILVVTVVYDKFR